ncbi:Enoyl-[acyl-carrier-protein] reductase [NADH] [Streptomyces sp. 3214.6]|nr:Enoyl-[acyl-carrier-protein] reductase [NADH] [Streptomyces sp. 3214.6]
MPGRRIGHGSLSTMSGILAGKRILVTGVLTDFSIAFHVAHLAQEEGAEVVLTGFGRLSAVERAARRLPKPAPLIELDVQNQQHLDDLAARVGEHLGEGVGLDGVVHSIGFSPQDALGGNFLNTPWSSVATAVEISAYSLKSLTTALLPLLERRGGSVVGMSLDSQVTWPMYDWMGVAKAALESTSRYLARDLADRNIRVNLVSAGPIKTVAARSIPGFAHLVRVWDERSPMEWDINDPEPAARGVIALLSDWFPKTTGEVVHVDGGLHAVGG